MVMATKYSLKPIASQFLENKSHFVALITSWYMDRYMIGTGPLSWDNFAQKIECVNPTLNIQCAEIRRF